MKRDVLIAVVTFVLGCIPPSVCLGAEKDAPKPLSVEDLQKSGFESKKVDGKAVDPNVNGLERRFNEKDELLKYFSGLGVNYDKLPFHKSSDILSRSKMFRSRGFWRHVREMPTGGSNQAKLEKVVYSVFALPT